MLGGIISGLVGGLMGRDKARSAPHTKMMYPYDLPKDIREGMTGTLRSYLDRDDLLHGPGAGRHPGWHFSRPRFFGLDRGMDLDRQSLFPGYSFGGFGGGAARDARVSGGYGGGWGGGYGGGYGGGWYTPDWRQRPPMRTLPYRPYGHKPGHTRRDNESAADGAIGMEDNTNYNLTGAIDWGAARRGLLGDIRGFFTRGFQPHDYYVPHTYATMREYGIDNDEASAGELGDHVLGGVAQMTGQSPAQVEQALNTYDQDLGGYFDDSDDGGDDWGGGFDDGGAFDDALDGGWSDDPEDDAGDMW